MTLLSQLPASTISSTTDQVFDALANAIISLELLPGSKISEIEIAKSLGVSRQPVRDAFFRLSQQGFLSIRPQRATLVTKISEKAVLEAIFVRIALEVACIRVAADKITDEELAGLRENLREQLSAIDSDDIAKFHALDELFHQRICEISGHPHVWNLIQEQKAHMDRVRFFTLHYKGQAAYDEHLLVYEALAVRDMEVAETRLRQHIGRIAQIMGNIRVSESQYFEED